MMKKQKLLLFIILFSTTIIAHAQVTEKKTLHEGDDLSTFAYYLFHDFSDATVKLKNGGTLTSKMNFNLFLCQMQFIDNKGDTLDLAKPEEIDSIYLHNSVFYFDKYYYEIFDNNAAMKIIAERKVSYDPVKIGALGLQNQSGVGIQSFTSLLLSTGLGGKLLLNEDIIITKETSYFFITKTGERIKANKNNFLSLFPNNKQQVEDFIKQNKTNFNRQPDLTKLFDFCASLT